MDGEWGPAADTKTAPAATTTTNGELQRRLITIIDDHFEQQCLYIERNKKELFSQKVMTATMRIYLEDMEADEAWEAWHQALHIFKEDGDLTVLQSKLQLYLGADSHKETDEEMANRIRKATQRTTPTPPDDHLPPPPPKKTLRPPHLPFK